MAVTARFFGLAEEESALVEVGLIAFMMGVNSLEDKFVISTRPLETFTWLGLLNT